MSVDCPGSSVTSSPVSPSAINCEIAILPVELLLSLQKSQFHLVGTTIEVRKEPGIGYNVIADGQVRVDGQQYNLVNCIHSKVTLTTHKEHKDFQKMILSKLMVFFTTVKATESSSKDLVYAVIVNTRHPRMRQEIENSMKDIKASEVGTKCVLQFTLQKAVQSYFSLKDVHITHNLGLEFTCEYKCSSSDVFHGCTTKTKELNGKILDLSCKTEDEKSKVKKLLDKMSEPIVEIKIGSVQSPGMVSSFQAGTLEDKVFSSTQPYAKHSSVKETSSSQLPAVNEKSYLLQFTQHLPKYIE
ncbi:mesenteric estrogen-dependent adipogenesis protein-like [Pristis pectinata]|uniref:mesenteric estrogen-dependent adipogenesis protein-like n=1 Tax=Pristis pectinata TaxID=685728 RepID=UPI00223E1D71|nr:mesenteric estrogen-dependent adipogenesis protein-like [Pristis pectinata]